MDISERKFQYFWLLHWNSIHIQTIFDVGLYIYNTFRTICCTEYYYGRMGYGSDGRRVVTALYYPIIWNGKKFLFCLVFDSDFSSGVNIAVFFSDVICLFGIHFHLCKIMTWQHIEFFILCLTFGGMKNLMKCVGIVIVIRQHTNLLIKL